MVRSFLKSGQNPEICSSKEGCKLCIIRIISQSTSSPQKLHYCISFEDNTYSLKKKGLNRYIERKNQRSRFMCFICLKKYIFSGKKFFQYFSSYGNALVIMEMHNRDKRYGKHQMRRNIETHNLIHPQALPHP